MDHSVYCVTTITYMKNMIISQHNGRLQCQICYSNCKYRGIIVALFCASHDQNTVLHIMLVSNMQILFITEFNPWCVKNAVRNTISKAIITTANTTYSSGSCKIVLSLLCMKRALSDCCYHLILWSVIIREPYQLSLLQWP